MGTLVRPSFIDHGGPHVHRLVAGLRVSATSISCNSLTYTLDYYYNQAFIFTSIFARLIVSLIIF